MQVRQRGPHLPRLPGQRTVGIVLIGRHHIDGVVPKGAHVEGAAALGQVAGMAAVTGRGWGLLAPQKCANSEAPTAHGRVPGRVYLLQFGHGRAGVGRGQAWRGGFIGCQGAGN